MSRQGGHLAFLIGPKITNLVEDVTILLSLKFHQIELCGFRGIVENVSVNQRSGRPYWFSNLPKTNTTLVEDVDFLLLIKFR